MARWNGTSWQVTHVDASPGEVGGLFVSLALDMADHPHISYAAGGGDPGQGELRYAYHDGANWHRTVVTRTARWPYIEHFAGARRGGSPSMPIGTPWRRT
jgi:hypothetical protein